MSVTIKVDFYQVELSEESEHTFEGLLEQVQGMPIHGDARTRTVNRYPVRLQMIETSGQLRMGDLLKIRLNEPAIKADTAGHIEQIPMDEDEGLGEETAFLYHPGMRILVLQRNHVGVSAPSLAGYFEQIAGPDTIITLNPVINADTMRRLAGLVSVRKLDIKIAGGTNPQIFNNAGHAIGDVADLLSEFEAPTVGVTVSMGRQRSGTLNVRKVGDAIRRLLRIARESENNVTKIRITGKDDDGDKESLDFLQDRMIEQVEIDKSGRDVTLDDRQRALHQAWERRRSELRTMFRSND